eukprot:1060657-Amphidinium_carterae.1
MGMRGDAEAESIFFAPRDGFLSSAETLCGCVCVRRHHSGPPAIVHEVSSYSLFRPISAQSVFKSKLRELDVEAKLCLLQLCVLRLSWRGIPINGGVLADALHWQLAAAARSSPGGVANGLLQGTVLEIACSLPMQRIRLGLARKNVARLESKTSPTRDLTSELALHLKLTRIGKEYRQPWGDQIEDAPGNKVARCCRHSTTPCCGIAVRRAQ